MSIMLDDEPLIKNGVYSVIYHSHYFINKFGRDLLVLQFQLAEITDDHKHSLFSMWLNLNYYNKNTKGKINFKVSKNSKLAKTWIRLFPTQIVKRWDRVPLSQLKGLILVAKIKEGTKDHEQKVKPKQLRISKIVEIKLPEPIITKPKKSKLLP